ncbi:hypothetical protein AALP_AA1G208500 [Arabis alpina]|uniref:Importin N-terminal domain-containing protein n=1 Tax=Arabis alpina TaxID=50452 RepID=A0A087HPJ5_ARAAL|nr:hypothetical protein AALP_AA1G208500 [Arabis alpina]
MAMEMTQFFVAAQSDDARVRNGAERSLVQFQEHHHFLLSLSFELANDHKPLESRQLAGILLKNSLSKQWIALNTVIKSQIKDLLLTTLASSASHTAAQVIAKVASIEISLKQWPQLVKSLLSNLSRQDSPNPLKQATLETLGYVFEEVSPEDLVQDNEESNYVFRAVVCGANRSQTSPELVLASINALLKALDYAHTKLEKRLHPHFC